jgi:2-oxo-4-hydroxy-4-carboxy--5-ureidoimidazoline (OHCU) decarboxylase
MIRSYLTTPEDLQQEETIRQEASQSLQDVPVEKPADTPSALTEVLAAPFRGIEGAVRNVYGLADYVTGDALPNWDHNFLGTSKTTAGSVVENASQFLAGFIPVFGWLGKAGQAAGLAGKAFGVARGLAAGAVADFSVFDGQQERLSNLIQAHPTLANPISEYLAADSNDSEIEGRFKNALEGAGLGALVDGLTAGLKGIAKARSLKAAGASAEEVNKALAEPLGSKENVEKILDSNKRPLDNAAIVEAPAAKEEITKIARGSYENGEIDVTKYVDSTTDLEALLKERQKYIVETHGTRPVEPVEETFGRVGSVIAGFTGKSEDAILSTLRTRAKSLEEATTFGLAAVDLMKATATEAQKYAKLVAAGDKTNENLLRSLAAQERLAELISISSGYGTLQGRALNARRYIKSAEIQSRDLAQQLVEQFGGTGYLSKNLEKVAAAASPEGVGKLVSNQLTLGGRLLRAHNEYWINAILSGPKTSVVNTLGNTFTTLYLPLEGAVGSVFRGDTTAAAAFLKQYVYIAESVQESTRFAFQAMRTGESVLNPIARVSDVVGSNAKIDAGFLANNAELATKGLTAEAKASAQALKSLDQTGLYHLLNFTGEVARLPQRFLTTADEFFKQLNYRSAAKTKLYFEGRTKGLEGTALGQFVNDGVEKTVTQGGEVFSEAAVYRQAMREAETKGLQGRYKQQFIDNYVEQNFNPANSALAQSADVASFARGVSEEATFTKELGPLGKGVQRLAQTHPLLQLVIPFVRTPTNMLKFVGQRTFAFAKLPNGIELPALSWVHKRALQ